MRWALPALASVLCSLGVLATSSTRQEPKEVVPTEFAPIAYFNSQCVYCHMADGLSFDPKSLASYSRSGLDARLLQMTDENAKSPLVDRDLEVLASWVRSLGKREPFVVWKGSKDGALTFEATKGAKLTSNAGDLTFEKNLWTLKTGLVSQKVKVTATYEKKKIVLDLSKSATSHPVTPPGADSTP